jgi:hypothetical protein
VRFREVPDSGVEKPEPVSRERRTSLTHLEEYWVTPPATNAAFVAAMEDVLEVYTRA